MDGFKSSKHEVHKATTSERLFFAKFMISEITCVHAISNSWFLYSNEVFCSKCITFLQHFELEQASFLYIDISSVEQCLRLL